MTRRIAHLVLESADATGIVPRELADALVGAVLEAPHVQLARALGEPGGPFEGRRVLELAGLVLEAAGEVPDEAARASS